MKSFVLAMPKLPPVGVELLSQRYDVEQLRVEQDGNIPRDWRERVIAIASPGRDPGLGGRLDARVFNQLPGLRVIVSFSSGTDGIDRTAANARGIPVLNVAAPLADPVADVALGLVIDTMRGITYGDRFVRAGHWASTEKPTGVPLAGRSAGILGLGRIGTALAKRLSACGMTIVYCSRSMRSDISYRYYSDAEALAAASDVLIACCPATPETQNIVNEAVLRALGPKGYFVNVSRGSVVDEAALKRALISGALAGAGLDVYLGEPAIDPAFFAIENAVLSPHLGGATEETRMAMFEAMVKNLDDFLSKDAR